MIRILLAFSLLAVMVSSCSGRYKINGESSIASLDGKMLFLKAMHDGTFTKVDSAEVIHGLFTMKGKLDSTLMVMLFMDEEMVMPVVLEGGHINVRIDNASIKAGGTPLNDKLYTFFDKKLCLDRRMDALERKEARMILNGDDPAEIERYLNKEGEKLTGEMDSLIEDFITSNYDNVLGPGVFVMLCTPHSSMTPQIEKIVKKAPESFRNNRMVRDYIQHAKGNNR